MRFAVLLLLTGCLLDQGRFEDRQRAICHPEAGCVERPWWPDSDGDGWGDPTGEVEWSVEALEGAANNLLDCDDTDPDLTANIAGLCPRELGPDGVATGGTTTMDLGSCSNCALEFIRVDVAGGLRLHEAIDACELGWGGILGGPYPGVDGEGSVWAYGEDARHPSWDDVGEAVPGPAVWTGSELRSVGLDASAAVACMRETPDPADWDTFEVPQ